MNKLISISIFSLLVACGSDGPDLKENGSACEQDSDCLSDDCRQELHSPIADPYPLKDGMCTTDCEWVDGDVQGTCDDGEACLRWAFGEKACFLSCDDDNPCERDGYDCLCVGQDYDGSCLASACIPPKDSAKIISEETEVPAVNPASVLK